MPFFAYKARNGRGEMVQGVLEAADTSAVADQLFGSGITPVEITLTRNSGTASRKGNIWARLAEDRIRPLDVQLFSRQMHTLLKAGVPIMRALAGLQESTSNKSFQAVLQDLRESLDSGRELSTALRRHPAVFSPFYISMVRVGEMTGMLDEIFMRLFDHMEFERDTRERVATALRYPIFVIIAMVVAMAVINLFVIPAFAKVYAGFHAQLPLMTQILIGTSNFTVHYWPLLAVLIAGAAMAFRLYIGTPNGRYWWDKLKLRIPVAGKIMRKGTLARFARSFALAQRSGIPIVQGLSVVAQVVDNAFIAQRVEQMRDGVERGETVLRTAATTNIFTPVVLQMIAVGEETGDLDGLMQEVAEMYEREVDYEIKTLAAQVEPILIVGLGLMVLVLALGVFLPIWDLGRVALHK